MFLSLWHYVVIFLVEQFLFNETPSLRLKNIIWSCFFILSSYIYMLWCKPEFKTGCSGRAEISIACGHSNVIFWCFEEWEDDGGLHIQTVIFNTVFTDFQLYFVYLIYKNILPCRHCHFSKLLEELRIDNCNNGNLRWDIQYLWQSLFQYVWYCSVCECTGTHGHTTKHVKNPGILQVFFPGNGARLGQEFPEYTGISILSIQVIWQDFRCFDIIKLFVDCK